MAVTEVAPPVSEAPKAESKPPRRSAIRDIAHKPAEGTSRAVKADIASKLDDKRFDDAMKDAGNDAPSEPEGRRRHKVTRTHHVVPEVKEETPASTKDETPPTTETTTDDKPVEKKDESKPEKVPDEIRRSLKNYGHSDEEIDEQFKSDPTGFNRFAKFVHATRQKEVEAYARLGQQQLPTAPIQPSPVQLPATSAGHDLTEGEIVAFEKLYPNDPAAKFIARDARANLAFRQQQTQQAFASAQAATQTAVNAFFDAESMKSYADHYKDQTKKDKVIETAAHIIQGARLQGKQFGVQEALTMAHDALASPVLKAAARKEIATEVAQRSAALTQRNQAGGGTEEESAAEEKKGRKGVSRKELESRTAERLRKIGRI